MSEKLIVAKFGGTSMGNAQAMRQSAAIVRDHAAPLVVVSATSGTTNQLLDIIAAATSGDWAKAELLQQTISQRHQDLARELECHANATAQIQAHLDELATLARGIFLLRECSVRAKDRIQSIGELLSSIIFTQVLAQAWSNQKIEFLDAREVLITDDQFTRATPIPELIKQRMHKRVGDLRDPARSVWVTQGFIGRTEEGETTTLGRGGSDYSASLFAEAVGADICEIWTDVSGIASTDPRLCSKARSIDEITFQEAAEMATFGAKVLHPTTLTPARRHGIAVFVGNTFAPKDKGTWIVDKSRQKPLVRALAIKKSQALLTISTPKMLHTHGFLYAIFKIFNDHKVAVDAITTSEISVAMTVDETTVDHKLLIRDLSHLGDVHIEKGMALVSLIGNNINSTAGLGKQIFSALENVNVRMICQGASLHNFCFLVNAQDGDAAVKLLHHRFLE
jgi:aspartate kinase